MSLAWLVHKICWKPVASTLRALGELPSLFATDDMHHESALMHVICIIFREVEWAIGGFRSHARPRIGGPLKGE